MVKTIICLDLILVMLCCITIKYFSFVFMYLIVAIFVMAGTYSTTLTSCCVRNVSELNLHRQQST